MYSHNKVRESLRLLNKRIVVNYFKAFYTKLRQWLLFLPPKQKLKL